MILIISIYVLICILLICFSIFFKGTKKKVSVTLSVIFIFIPFCIFAFLSLFKTEMQKGKFLPGIGQVIILVAPPEDLWVPLGKIYLENNKNKYHFEIVHKYVGNHVIDLSFKKLEIMEVADNNFEFELVIMHGEKEVLNIISNEGWPYWGANKTGLIFISYQVPEDIPVNTKLSATIKVKGDIATFAGKYGQTKLSIRKGSDI